MTTKKTTEQKVLSYLRKEVIPNITYNTYDNNYYLNGEIYDLYKLQHVLTEKIGTLSVNTLSNMLKQEVNYDKCLKIIKNNL